MAYGVDHGWKGDAKPELESTKMELEGEDVRLQVRSLGTEYGVQYSVLETGANNPKNLSEEGEKKRQKASRQHLLGN